MTLVVQILLLLTALAALVATILSAKNWHWSQVLLVVGIFLATIGYMFLAAETLRVHRNLRAGLAKKEKDLADYVRRNEALVKGTDDAELMVLLASDDSPLDEEQDEMDGLLELEHQLKLNSRQRGRVWRGVAPTGQVDETGRVAVEVPGRRPHGLQQNVIVYAFEAGPPNSQNPDQGPQYLGEFKVVESGPDGVVLEPAQLFAPRSREGQRLTRSRGPWNLYETMPIDSHSLFTDDEGKALPEEELRKLLPPGSVEEYVRQGTPATEDDDEWHRAGFDEDGQPVGPDNIDQAVTFRYDRPLRDYAFLFDEFARQRVVTIANIEAVREDNAKLKAALASAEQLSAFREQQITSLTADLKGMKQDRQAIEEHRDHLLRLVRNAQQYLDLKLAENSALAQQLTDDQVALSEWIDSRTPAPEGSVSLP